MSKPIIVVGSINLDLIASAENIPRPGETLIGNTFRTFFGGKGANQAVAVARLGYPSIMIGNVGDDAFGEQLKTGLSGRFSSASEAAAGAVASSIPEILEEKPSLETRFWMRKDQQLSVSTQCASRLLGIAWEPNSVVIRRLLSHSEMTGSDLSCHWARFAFVSPCLMVLDLGV
jgi:pfkB family carbohydrate kinase